ncbi:MAG: glycine cleavage system aminomethyltransferase GcvT [Calditrichota bacterium]
MSLKRTAFYDLHVKHGGKMVPFAGYEMPIQYSGILEEHKRVRSSVGVFDVSHMGEVIARGEKALDVVNRIVTNNVAKTVVGQAQYNAMCLENGGIIDDLIVYNRGENELLLVINASNIDKDFAWMQKHASDGVEFENISDDISQLAVQGKDAITTLQKLTDVNLSEIKFYRFVEDKLAGVEMIMSATGYTGEPGFELYFPREYSEEVWEKIFKAGAEFDIAPIGLGARDSLRLEKKYCLYGNDIDETINTYEAGLGWITKLKKGDFIGRDALQAIKDEGIKRKLAGFVIDGRMIPRTGYAVLHNSETVGNVTSGCFSPILEKNIGLAYVPKDLAVEGTEIEIEARGRKAPARIVKTPFVE